jgi:hypothetical protein
MAQPLNLEDCPELVEIGRSRDAGSKCGVDGNTLILCGDGRYALCWVLRKAWTMSLSLRSVDIIDGHN